MNFFRRLALVVVAFLFSLSLLANNFWAGASKVEITPPMKVPLAGYGARMGMPSRGVLDPVYVRALVITDGKTKLAMVSADLLIILKDLKEEIMSKISDLDIDYLLLGATHTHSGPGGYSDIFIVETAVLGGYHPKFRKFLVNKIAEAIKKANSSLKPAKFGSIIGTAPGYNINRRHPKTGKTDPSLGVIRITDLSGKTIAYIINYTAHPTCLSERNMKISGDYVGILERTIEERDPGSVALFFNGALGDQGPNCKLKEKGIECMRRLGLGLADEVWKLIPKIKLTGNVNLTVLDKMAKMPPAQVRKGCWGILRPAMKKLSKKLVRDKGEFMAIEINDTLIYASSAELAVEVGLHLKAQHPDKKVLVFAHCNDWLGYLLTPEEYDIGKYEACMSLYGRDFEPYFEKTYKELTSSIR